MATAEVTSSSPSDDDEGLPSDPFAVGVTEVTSESDDDAQPRARGRGRRGRGRTGGAMPKSRGRSRGGSVAMPKSRGRGRGQKKHGLDYLHKPRPKEEQDGEVTSESSETARIEESSKRARTWTANAEETSDSDEAHLVGAATMGSASMPTSSGCFDYTQWLVSKLTSEQWSKLARAFTYLDLCAGLGTTIIAHEALRRALLLHDLRINGKCAGLTESSRDRREALKRRLVCVESTAPIWESNKQLASEDEPTIADILFMGIVCVDISRCSSTPKSLLDDEGASGTYWLDLLVFLDSLRFEALPKAIVLECVDNLDNIRNVKGRWEKGTTIVIEALRERGYVGQWLRISATHFGLPQRRPRVWGLFLKVRGGVGPKALEKRTEDLTKALEIVRVGECSGYEPLEDLLARTRDTHAFKPPRPSGRKSTWREDSHPKFKQQHNLTQDDILIGQKEFLTITQDIITAREQGAVWLELCKLRKQGTILDWKEHLLVSDCGSSVGWLSIVQGMFPCLRPGNKYLLLHHGQAKLARGPLCLALQGIGGPEAEAFNLLIEDDALLRGLAGNAFCANITCALIQWSV